MTKSKSSTENTETEIKHAGTPFAFKVIKKVRVGTLKIKDEGEVFIRALEAIAQKQSPVKGDDEVMRMKEIDILRVTDLTTNEVKDMVVGAALKSALLDFGGGNGKYIGNCFRIAKHKAREGKRFKDYEVDQIEDPEHAEK